MAGASGARSRHAAAPRRKSSSGECRKRPSCSGRSGRRGTRGIPSCRHRRRSTGRWGCPSRSGYRAGSRRATKARARANSRWPAARGRCSAPAIGSPRPAWRTPACSLPPGSRRNRARCARRRRSRPAYGRESRRRRCAATLSPGRSRPPASGRELIHRGRAAWLPPEMRRASTRRPEAAAMRPRYP